MVLGSHLHKTFRMYTYIHTYLVSGEEVLQKLSKVGQHVYNIERRLVATCEFAQKLFNLGSCSGFRLLVINAHTHTHTHAQIKLPIRIQMLGI